MRKNLFVLLAAALMVVTGCKKDDNTAGNDNGAKMTFTATIDNGGSKTTIEGVDMNWTKGDVISINGKDFTADEAGASTTFTGDEVGKKDGKYMAYYLVTMGEGGSLSLPASQTYAGANLAGVNPMYAESTTTTLLFHNICALIKLDLKGTGSVKTITASANQPLKGTFEILTNEEGGYYAHATSTADADKSVVLNCGNGEALDGTAAKTFYIALPQGEYTGLKLTLSDGTYTYPIEISGNKTLTAGIMYGKEVAGVEFVAPVPEGALKGKFSIASGKQVYFSKGNLRCNITTNPVTWSFEEHQYDYQTLPGSIRWDQFTNVSHFTWSDTYSGSSTNSYAPYSCPCYSNSSSYNKFTVFFANNNNFPLHKNGGWYALSKTEWNYLLNTRSNASSLRGFMTVGGKYGMVILPDGSSLRVGTNSWTDMEAEGAVFLPAAGKRNGTIYSGSGAGYYWTSELDSGRWEWPWRLTFSNGSFSLANQSESPYGDFWGQSIRLVMNVPK